MVIAAHPSSHFHTMFGCCADLAGGVVNQLNALPGCSGAPPGHHAGVGSLRFPLLSGVGLISRAVALLR